MKNTKVSINKNMPGNAGNITIGEGTMASAILRDISSKSLKMVTGLKKWSQNLEK